MKTQDDVVKLGVLEERVNTMCKQNNADHAEILKKIEEINDKLDCSFVPISRFVPVERIAYGMITVIMLAVLGAIVKLVIR